MKLRNVLAASAALMLMTLPALAGDPAGTWATPSGKTTIKIAPCGGALCGVIVAVKGEQKDVNNPDAAKRDRSLVGANLIWDLKPGGDTYTGSLYDYTSGKTYTGKLRADGDKLELSGCVAMGLVCRGETWNRVK